MSLQWISRQHEICVNNFSHQQSIPNVEHRNNVEKVGFRHIAQQDFSSRLNHSFVKGGGTRYDKNFPRLWPRDSQTSENLLERLFHTVVVRNLSHPALEEVRREYVAFPEHGILNVSRIATCGGGVHYLRYSTIDKAACAQEKQQECRAECSRKFAPAQLLRQCPEPEANAERQEKHTRHNIDVGAHLAQNRDPCDYI